jgi:hypothetical protein
MKKYILSVYICITISQPLAYQLSDNAFTLKKLLGNFLIWSSQHNKDFSSNFKVRVPNPTKTVSSKVKKETDREIV